MPKLNKLQHEIYILSAKLIYLSWNYYNTADGSTKNSDAMYDGMFETYKKLLKQTDWRPAIDPAVIVQPTEEQYLKVKYVWERDQKRRIKGQQGER